MKMRFAPSPTGYMHLANARTALLNYVKCKELKGEFILRIDDTDTQRSEEKYVEQILKDLQWLGMRYDRIERQSSRLSRYHQVIDMLKSKGVIYPAYETQQELTQQREKQLALGTAPRYRAILGPESGRIPHWRFKLQSKLVHWEDGIMGHMEFKGEVSSDPIVVREDGSLTYLLASIIDDYDMQITHIIRGRDHVSNSALQLQMLEELDTLFNTKTSVSLAHFPLISDITGEKFSKRQGSYSLKSLQNEWIHPKVVVCFLLGLGLSYQLPVQDLESIKIDWSQYGKGDLKCDTNQIYRLNADWIASLSAQDAQGHFAEFSMTKDAKFWEIAKFNIKTSFDMKKWQVVYDKQVDQTGLDEALLASFAKCIAQSKAWDEALALIKQEHSNLQTSQIAQPLRQALTGFDKGPKMSELFELWGSQGIVDRLAKRQ